MVTVIWIVWNSGPTYTKIGSPHCLGVWYAMLMPCGNYWACVMVHMYLFHPLMKREILLTIFVWIDILRLFILYHFLSYSLWYLTFCHNLLLFIVIACVFYLFIYPSHMLFLSIVFYCAIFTCKLCAKKDIKIYVYISSCLHLMLIHVCVWM